MRAVGKRILVAGIGNVFHGDDAFGVEVAHELLQRDVPDEVQVAEFGIRSYDLAFAILDGYETVILVDAVARDAAPGTLFLLDPIVDDTQRFAPVSGHSMNPQAVLSLVNTMGGYDGRLLIVGCQPGELESKDGKMGLTEDVRKAVREAVALIERVVDGLIGEERNEEKEKLTETRELRRNVR